MPVKASILSAAQAGVTPLNPMRGVLPWLIAALTLGLAPFVPEPHLLGKLRWVAGGAVGMSVMDWLDLAFHGAPWVGLLITLFTTVRRRMAGRVR